MKKTFKELGLSHGVLEVLEKAGFTEPTEIQEKTIPLALAGKDIIGGSATGSGKTLAFASSIIENLKSNGYVQALILTPTRELAEQVSESIKDFSKNKKLSVVAVYGGVDINPQMRKIARADIVVATPGRILDHLNRRTLRLDKVKFLVLDEVDRMFDMGFHKDVEKIIQHCPTERQTMLFSATISSEVDHLAKKYTRKPVEVSVESYIDHSHLKQVYYDVPSHLKFSLLVHLLQKEGNDLVMIFCSTRRNVDFVAGNLQRINIDAKAIHGGMVQNKRLKVMNEFNGVGGVNVLVCTDVAARGLDIKGVSHVYNYDLSKTSDEYIHRIGRTARAGAKGKAISILSSRDYENFRNICSDEYLQITHEELPKINIVSVGTEFGRGRTNDYGRDRMPSRGGNRFGGSYNRPRGDSRFGRSSSNSSDRWGNKPRSDNRYGNRPRTDSRFGRSSNHSSSREENFSGEENKTRRDYKPRRNFNNGFNKKYNQSKRR